MTKQILIVDDDTSLSNSISNYLAHEGFYVSTAYSVKSALQKINDTKPDLIITDIMMPFMDGYDLIKILRLDNTLFSIPIVFLTAKGMTEDRIKGYGLGCNAYLTKPFDPQELLAIINNLFTNIDLLQASSNSNINVPKTVFISPDTCLLLEHLDLSLTQREITILHLVVKGCRNKEIAQSLKISVRSVEKYVSRLLNKTDTRNRTELAQFAAKSLVNLSNQRANDGTRTRE